MRMLKQHPPDTSPKTGSNREHHYSVTLLNESRELERTVVVAEDEFILDIAEEEGLELPYSCRAGNCFDCLGKVVAGKVEQTAKAIEFLRPEELEAGYVLLCAASPLADCRILTHQTEVLLGDD